MRLCTIGLLSVLSAALVVLAGSAIAQSNSESTGTHLFNDHCANCHGNPQVERAPSPTTLKQMVPEHIYDVITNGAMQAMAADLTDQQRREIAEYLGGRKIDTKEVGAAKSMPNSCQTNPPIHDLNGPAWNGWGVDNSNSRFQSSKDAGLSTGQVSRLKLKWAFGFPNATAMYMETVVDGNLFVSSNAGYLYSLDAKTGCVHWSFKPQSTVRSGVVIAPSQIAPSRYAAYFGDIHGKVYAVDASTGEQIWKVSVDPDPLVRITMTPKFYEGRLYVPVASLEEPESGSANHLCCTFRGMVVALDANNGHQIWKSYTISETPKVLRKNSHGLNVMGPSGSGVWSSPVVDPKTRAVYVGTGNQFTEPPVDTTDAVMAFDLDTGKLLWSFQGMHGDIWHEGCTQMIPKTGVISGTMTPPAPPVSSTSTSNFPGPLSTHQGPQQARPGAPAANYPKENCPTPLGPDWDFAAAPTLATLPDGRNVLIAAQKQGLIYAFDPKTGKLLWKNPVARWVKGGLGDTVFGGAVDGQYLYWGLQSGGVIAIELATGAERWWTPWNATPEMYRHPGVSAAVSLMPGVIFATGMDGRIKALQSFDGRSLWEFDTNKEFDTVNGVAAHGGTIGAGGAIAVDGMVFVGSGYLGFQGGMPGNVLLAFGP